MTTTNAPAPYYNDDPSSFAWTSARERWPVILTNAIDDVHRAVADVPLDKTEKLAEGKQLISKLVGLKHELEHDRKLAPLEGDAVDLKAYNDDLAKLPENHNSWLTAPWLYSECYLYRKIGTFTDNTKHWKNYDIFLTQKDDTFRNSQAAVSELALRYHQLADQLKTEQANDKALEVLFREFIDISLWGNATDLSLLTSISLEDIQALQGAESRKKNQKNVLANDLDDAWNQVNSNKGGRVDIVLDNAGFELYTDIVLVLFLLDSGLADTLVLHPKLYPWFVSDVLPADFLHLINNLRDPAFFPEGKREELDYLVEKLSSYHEEGKIVIRTSPFWTTQYGFSEIKQGGAAGGEAVWQDLKESKLVIFKGDLNHRKLLWDLAWPKTTPFLTAIGELAQSGIHVLTLRTCKADTASGLQPGKEQELEQEWEAAGNKHKQGWVWSGKYALVQYSKGS